MAEASSVSSAGLDEARADAAASEAGRPLSVLVLSAYPDERRCTQDLKTIRDHHAERHGCDVHVWFLRRKDHQVLWHDSRVVDGLRTWLPARTLSAVGLEQLAGALRARVLRRWFRAVDPDVVILDDGLGERLLPYCPRPPVVVVRMNDEPPDLSSPEPSVDDRTRIEIVLMDPTHTDHAPTGGQVIVRPGIGDAALLRINSERRAIGRSAGEAQRDQARAALGIPSDAALVVGWGADGWLDGPDLFIRALWALEQRGVQAHGLWLGLGSDQSELTRLRTEADRCGIGERMCFGEEATRELRLCGDAVLVTDRSPGRSREELLEAIVAGLPVTAFETLDLTEASIDLVPPLDIPGAAASLERAVADRSTEARLGRQRAAERRLDLCSQLFASARGPRDR